MIRIIRKSNPRRVSPFQIFSLVTYLSLGSVGLDASVDDVILKMRLRGSFSSFSNKTSCSDQVSPGTPGHLKNRLLASAWCCGPTITSRAQV